MHQSAIKQSVLAQDSNAKWPLSFSPVLYKAICSLQSFTFMSVTVVMFQPSWIFFIYTMFVWACCVICVFIAGVIVQILMFCFMPWWNMPSVRASNMHILNLPDVNYSYHTHVHRIVHSHQKRPWINGALFLLRQLVLCLFIIRAAGFTRQENNSEGVAGIIIQSLIVLLFCFLVFTFW